MKKIIIIILVCFFNINVFAQKIAVDDSRNGVRMIMTDNENISLGLNMGDMSSKGDLLFRLCKFSTKNKTEYMLVFSFQEIEKARNFPHQAELKITTKDGFEIVLYCLESFVENNYPTGMFPISEDNLQKIKEGTKSLRFEMFTINKKGIINKEYIEKKSNIGKDIQKMSEVIDLQSAV